MPWCPKCRLEYRKGIKVCSDCNVELVDFLETEKERVPIMTSDKEEFAQRFIEFLEYSRISSGEVTRNKETNEFMVSVDKEDEKEAGKLFKAFYITEVTEAAEHAVNEEESSLLGEEAFSARERAAEESAKEVKNRPSGVYVKREDKYKDLSSTAKIFYVFGVFGILYILLNASGFIHFINGIFSYIVYSIIFAGCLVVGFTTQRSAKIAKMQIKEERDLTEAIKAWLNQNISLASFSSLEEEGLSDEVIYLNRTNYIKALLLEKFENLDESYADQLIEDYYNENF